MKKLIFILIAVAGLFASAQAQRINIPATAAKSATGYVLDTVTSTAAHYMTTLALPATTEVTIVALFSEISGTTAGTASVQGSVDGTVWADLTRDNSDSVVASYTVTDVASQTKSWTLANCAYKYLRVKVVGISTPNFTISAKYYGFARQ